jgi:catechol 2,3-dioxygenase-like lactoylglutathione lyase family enzyme
VIFGAHFLLYSTNPDADRAFLRDVLGMRYVDVGHGWSIFKAPPTELAVHPAESEFVQSHADQKMLGLILYLMCDDLDAEIKSLAAKGVKCGKVETAEWGIASSIPLPSGASIGLYQPKHEVAIDLK